MKKIKNPSLILYRQIAEQLHSDIKKHSIVIVPSITQLSKLYGVSYRTMLKSVHHLRAQGILDFSQGKTMIMADPKKKQVEKTSDVPHQGLLKMSSSQRFYQKMKGNIENGTLRTGQELPKVLYFSATEKLSAGTICRVFTLLEQNRLIHKNGKKWIAGPYKRPETTGVILGIHSGNEDPVVLFLLPLYRDIAGFSTTFLTPFSIELFSELNKKNVGTVLALWKKDDALGDDIISGRGGVLSLIQKLGKRYCGTLMKSRSDMMPEFREWAEWMTQFKKPVVWFDDAGNPETFDRHDIPRKEFYRCIVDEEMYCSLAVDILHALGHRKIGLLDHNYPGNNLGEWVPRRIHLMKKYGGELDPPVQFTVKETNPNQWMKNWATIYSKNDNRMLEFINRIKQKIGMETPGISPRKAELLFKKRLAAEIPSLTTLISDDRATALIALDQVFAINYYYWLRHMGIIVPKQFSLMALGHNFRLNHHPLSSIDPRLDTLGYLAAHILIGDIFVKADRWGNVVTRPEFIDRGSVGKCFK